MDYPFLARNIKRLRLKLHLSYHFLAVLLGTAKGTVVSMEKGNNIRSDVIDKLTDFFFLYSWDDLSKKDIDIPDNLKQQIIDHFHDKPDRVLMLYKNPPLRFAIQEHLLTTNELDKFIETDDIRKLLITKFGWDYKKYLSRGLNTLGDILEIVPHPEKGGTHLYRKKSN